MNLKERKKLVEDFTHDSDFADFVCKTFVFDVFDVDEEIDDQNKAGVIDPRTRISLKLKNFRFDLRRLLEMVVDAGIFISSDLISGNNAVKILTFLKMVAQFTQNFAIKLERDHLILIACLYELNGFKTQLEKEKVYDHYNKIKLGLGEETLSNEEFALIVDAMASLKVLKLDEEKLLLLERIVFKKSLNELYT
ncbi:MAG: hypothetical protein FWG10_09195 [Eubacteriaceae bacterium]|nr:hypothetical protein [Eubacteriaceae bacterium]